MRQVLPVAMLGALLTMAPWAVAQHVGAGHSAGFSGGHGGFSGGFHGGFSAPRGYSGFASHGYGLATRSGGYSAYRPSYGASRQGWGRGGGDGYRPAYRRGYGYPYGYPYGYLNSWALLPWDLGYPDFTGYGDDTDTGGQQAAEEQPPPPQEYAGPPGYAAPPDEGYRSEYALPPWPTTPAPAASPAPVRPEPQLTLIFRDGHTQVIRNYMLTPSEVIVMDDAASGKEPQIPLSDLNLPATEQAAHAAGLDFKPPSL